MIWTYLNTGTHTGSFNMEFDLALVKDSVPDHMTLRLYRWDPFCISLGANQDISEINKEKAASDGIDIVKRPTGGRAILHSEELTYSVVMPLSSDISPRGVYRQINHALLEGLKIYDNRLAGLELEGAQPDLHTFYKENLSAACFGVPAKSEIKYEGKKVVGSAQRKIGNVLLQHGSIMCGNYHVNLADYLNLPLEELLSIRKELLNKTTELESILGYETDYPMLEESIVSGFEKYYDVNMVKEELLLNNL
jgi:lipoate-protein ligase A